MYLSIKMKKQRYLQKLHFRKKHNNDMFMEVLSWLLIVINVFFIVVNSYISVALIDYLQSSTTPNSFWILYFCLEKSLLKVSTNFVIYLSGGQWSDSMSSFIPSGVIYESIRCSFSKSSICYPTASCINIYRYRSNQNHIHIVHVSEDRWIYSLSSVGIIGLESHPGGPYVFFGAVPYHFLF